MADVPRRAGGAVGFQAEMTDPTRAELRTAICAHLGRVLGGLAPDALDALAGEAGERFLAGGDELFREGDPGDAAYLILSGRLRAVRQDSGGERLLQEMGPGEFVGEMPLVRPGPRAATVRAVRDSHLATLTPESFERVTERHPKVLHRIAGILVDRLRAQVEGAGLRRAPVRTIAVAPAGPGAPVRAVAVGLERALGRLGAVRRIDARGFAEARPELSSPVSEGPDPRIASWLAEQESESGVLVYEGDPEPGAWTQRCLRQADHVVWVAAAAGGGVPWLERALGESRCAADRSLVAFEGDPVLPTPAPFRFASTLRAATDFDRLARLVTGRAVGVVLGGGGARALAHLGVLRALEELGVSVDAIGGTSAGAAVAAMAARGLDAAGAREICRQQLRSVFDPTVPVVAMLRGRRIAALLAELVGPRSIEELAIPFLSISTNLSRGSVRVHRTGPLLRAVRASVGIPGILPPVVEGGELLVDGALLDNLPVLAMRELTGGGPVLAVEVGVGISPSRYPDFPDELSGWSALRRRFGGPDRGGSVPSIFEILMRSAMVSSISATGRTALREGIDLGLAPPVQDVGLFAFDRLDEIAERGYRAAIEPVRAWWEGLRAGR